jgi:hypothetical protein
VGAAARRRSASSSRLKTVSAGVEYRYVALNTSSHRVN